jgi:NADH-quinone oxidoreductase subunit N
MPNNAVNLILPGLIVGVMAIVVLFFDAILVKRKGALAWIAAAGLAVAGGVAAGQWLTWKGGWKIWLIVTHDGFVFNARKTGVGFGDMVSFDRYSLFFIGLFCFTGILTIMLSEAYLDRHRAKPGEYYGLLLLVITGMIGMAISSDLIAFFVSFELMSLPTYVMAGYLRRNKRSGEAALKYFVNGAFASAILLFGFALLYGVTGQTSYVGIASALGLIDEGNLMSIVALVMIIVGLGFKIAAVPFHGWAPDVYEGAPTPVTAFMSVGIKAGAFAAIVRLFTVALWPHWGAWTNMLIVVAVLTMVVGNVLALPQRNLKRMLAYSSIAHAGYLLLGIIALGAAGLHPDTTGPSAILFYLVTYTLMNIGAFGILVLLRNRHAFDYSLDRIAGLGRSMPWAALAMTVFMLSLTGIPPLAGFWGKFYLFTAIVDAGYTWLAIVAVVMSAVSAFYYLRVVWYMYFREAEESATAVSPWTPGVVASLAVAALGVVAVGLYPNPLITAAQYAAKSLLRI